MFSRYIILLLLFTFGESSMAQTYTQTIRGKVVDIDSKAVLIGASVVIIGSEPQVGTTSDADGKFRLEKVAVGRQNLKISLLGYEDVYINNIVVSSAKEIVLTVEMQEKIYNAKTVEIVAEHDKTKANNDLTTISARSFNSEETNRYAGTRGDPSKMVASYAGVSSGNDARNDIIVRGNSPLGVLWRLEGIEIPNPNHFASQGATGGPISILNNNVLSNSDFLTGAFPAEYGNKNAAVFDLKMRNGNNEKREYVAQLGINGIELGAEGPFSKNKNGSYMLNYRYSTLEVFNLLGINFGVSGIPHYQDCSFKFNMPTTKAGIFSLWGVAGKSRIAILDSEKKETDWSFTGAGEDLIYGSSMAATGLSHIYIFNSRVSGKFTLAATGSGFLATVDTLSVNKDKFLTYENRSKDWQYQANYTLNAKISGRSLIRAGFNYSAMFFDYKEQYYSGRLKQYVYPMKSNDNTGLLQSYLHWQWRLTGKLVTNAGIHYQQFFFNNTYAVEPRAGIKYQLSNKQNLSLGYGLHNQMQPLIYYFYRTYDITSGTYQLTNKDLGFTQAQHLILGYDQVIGKNFRIKSETYYQWIDKAAVEKRPGVFSVLNAGSDLSGVQAVDSLVNKGKGENYGIELTLEKFFSHNYYFLFTASLFESKYTGSDNIERYTAFSGGYALNLLGGIEIPIKNQNRVIAVDGKLNSIGGNRYIPIDENASQLANSPIYDYANAYEKQYKNYFRADLKVSYKINQKKVSQSFFVSVDNILNRKNVLEESYDPAKHKIITEYQLGLFPYGGYRIEF
jgi:hypothetical protein